MVVVFYFNFEISPNFKLFFFCQLIVVKTHIRISYYWIAFSRHSTYKAKEYSFIFNIEPIERVCIYIFITLQHIYINPPSRNLVLTYYSCICKWKVFACKSCAWNLLVLTRPKHEWRDGIISTAPPASV